MPYGLMYEIRKHVFDRPIEDLAVVRFRRKIIFRKMRLPGARTSTESIEATKKMYAIETNEDKERKF